MTPVERARSYLGRQFRPQGRHAPTGFDCVGLVCAAHLIDADEVPRDYRLRGFCVARLLEQLERFFSTIPVGEATPGDVALLQPCIDQFHLGILTERGMIHADARLRKVIETPRISAWPILSAHRRTTSE
jgi:lipoprotein Spr